jgi:CRP-like cAMP-binding protein
MGCGGSKAAEETAERSVGVDKADEHGGRRKSVTVNRREGISSGKAQSLEEGPATAQAKPAAPKTADQLDRLRSACSNIMIFSTMTSEQQGQIFDTMFEVLCEKDNLVIQQGEIGDVLYIVESGVFNAHLRAKGDEVVREYRSGELFGELALMYNCPRAATIKAAEAGRLWGLSRGMYETVVQSSLNVKMDTKSQFLRSVEQLSTLAEAERETLSELLEEVSFSDGEYLWRAGDPADCLILIKHGQVRVEEQAESAEQRESRLTRSSSATARLEKAVALNVGDFFGTQALLDLAVTVMPRRRVSGVAVGKCDVYKLHRSSASKIGDLPEIIINNSRVKAVRNQEWFTGLTRTERLAVCRRLPRVGLARGSTIVRKDEITGQGMRVVLEGAVTALSGATATKETLTEGDVFLAESLTERGFAAPAQYEAAESVVCCVVDRAKLFEMSEYRDELLAETEEEAISLDELSLIATLGVGGFGRVKMVSRPNGDHYALKCMYKGLVIAKRQTEHILNERRLLGMCRHTFLPRLVATFQDASQIYVLMDLIQGGELFTLVANRGRLPEEASAFYAANVACALEYLHARSIAYRDLKPENLMIDESGYLIVVDFGFAKVVEDRTFTVCGTPEYLAPETIRRAGHTCTVDWWALGVLLYEIITGQSPFYGGSQMDVLTRIVAARVPRNELLSPGAWEFILELLEVDPIRRLGSRVRGRRGVREHAFFASHLDVNALEARKLEPPWLPKIASKSDLRNFDDYGKETEGDPKEWERYIKLFPEAFVSW